MFINKHFSFGKSSLPLCFNSPRVLVIAMGGQGQHG